MHYRQKVSRGTHTFFHHIFILSIFCSDPQEDAIGGIIKKGELGWIAIGSHLEVVSLKTGDRVASYTFDNAVQ